MKNQEITAQELYNMAEKWVNTLNFIQLSVFEKMTDNCLYEYIEQVEICYEDFINDYQLHGELLSEIQEHFDDVTEGIDLFKEEDFENEVKHFCENNEHFDSFREDRERDNYPMWNILFEFKHEPSEEVKEACINAGFGIIEGVDTFNTTLFASGCGYSFYGQHWIPLFLELPWNSNIKEQAKGVDYSMM